MAANDNEDDGWVTVKHRNAKREERKWYKEGLKDFRMIFAAQWDGGKIQNLRSYLQSQEADELHQNGWEPYEVTSKAPPDSCDTYGYEYMNSHKLNKYGDYLIWRRSV